MDNRQTERTPLKCFRCGSKDHLIAKDPKPPKENEKNKNQVRFSERGNRASQKKYDSGDNYNDQKIYAYMARMSDTDDSPSRDFCISFQLTNCTLDSGAMCHMTPQVSKFIPGSL